MHKIWTRIAEPKLEICPVFDLQQGISQLEAALRLDQILECRAGLEKP